MTKSLIKRELAQVNAYIDERIKKGKKFTELEILRKKLIKELNK